MSLTILGGTELSNQSNDHLQKAVAEENVFSGVSHKLVQIVSSVAHI